MKIPTYLEWLRQQPCIRCYKPGPNDPHHCGYFGTAKRNHDEYTCSLCRRCHEQAERNKINKRWLIERAVKQFSKWLSQLPAGKKEITLIKLYKEMDKYEEETP